MHARPSSRSSDVEWARCSAAFPDSSSSSRQRTSVSSFFVIGRKDEDSHVEQGIFQAAPCALDWQIVTGSDAGELIDVSAWFSENLERPASFGHDKLRRGICWFKTGATEHISRIWEMASILERNGTYVKKIRTDRPGYVTYEEEWQLVAGPFRKGTMPR
jgi:hypothetical protein